MLAVRHIPCDKITGVESGHKQGMSPQPHPISHNPTVFSTLSASCLWKRTRPTPRLCSVMVCTGTPLFGIAASSLSSARGHHSESGLNSTSDSIAKPLVSRGGLLCGSGRNSQTFRRQLNADDIASGIVDVLGWTVKFEVKGGAMGKVSEVVRIGPGSVLDYAGTSLTWLKVVESAAAYGDVLGEQVDTHVLEGTFPSGTHAVVFKQHRKSSSESILLATEILVPVVDEIVRGVDRENRTLIIFPPEGLLELARRPQVIRRLYPAITEFCKQHPPEHVRQRSIHTRIKNLGLMPTRKQLQQAGKQGMIREINAAGGFISVAQTLNLGASRRPSGFWESLRRLDIEIECFIWESWTMKFDKCTGTVYYWNKVTNERTTEKPDMPNISDFVKAQGAAMPRQSTVMEAKRWDLHHAIIFNGGYKAVGHALQRWTVYVRGQNPRRSLLSDRKSIKKPSSMDHCHSLHSGNLTGFNSTTVPSKPSGLMTLSQLIFRVNKLMKTRGLSEFPTYKDLQEQDQNLFSSVKSHGGRLKVAKAMNIKLRRNKRGQWSSLAVAGAALRSYMCNKIAEEKGLNSEYDEELLWKEAAKERCLRLPTHTEVLKDGRADLHYVLQRFGRYRLAQHLMIPQRVMLRIYDEGF